jgi:RNA polymerase sigma factor (sigma-70 family)
MTTTRAQIVLRHIRELTATEKAARLLDRELLTRFTAEQEEDAFAALVRRHGPLVLGVCRRVLGNWHDAEDAFQASFLVLARKAASIHKHESVSSWLHRVAYHVAIQVRERLATRQRYERQTQPRLSGDALAEVTGRELVGVLDEELQGLAEGDRAPLVLCYLEGKTRDEAAHQLGLSLGTFKRRLERAKERLRLRLARRGLTLSVVGLAPATTSTAISSGLIATTVDTALQVTAGQATTAVAATTAALADGVIRSLFATRLLIGSVFVLLFGVLALGVGAITRSTGNNSAAQPALLAPMQGKSAEGQFVARVGKAPLALVPEKAEPEKGEQVTVSGRVVDGKGKAIPGAAVAVFAQNPWPYSAKELAHLPNQPKKELRLTHASEAFLTAGTADAEGRYRLKFSQKAFKKASWYGPWVTVVGIAKGYAVGWEGIELKGASGEIELRLTSEEPIHGKLIDLQGQPAAGVSIHLVQTAKEVGGKFSGLKFFEVIGPAPYWPAPVKTDAKGQFTLHGVNKTMFLVALIRDDRFALHALRYDPSIKGEVLLPLAPARIIEGRVIKEDNRQPVAGIKVSVVAYPKGDAHNTFLEVTTDKDGRFRVNHYPADRFDVRTGDPEGQPYFAINFIDFNWPKGGKIKHQIEVVLPRGVLQSGKVVDASGMPVAGARLLYLPKLHNNPFIKGDPIDLWQRQIGRAKTKDDGSFQITVMPGPGHLVIYGPYGQQFVRRWMDHKDIFGYEQGGALWYGHGFIKVYGKTDGKTPEVVGKIQRSAPLTLEVLDADGKPANGATALVVEFAEDERISNRERVEVKEGRAELKSCALNEAYRILVFDAKKSQGILANVVVKGKEKPQTVRLQAFGSAKARLVDAQGKPLVKYQFGLWIQDKGIDGKEEGRVLAPPGLQDKKTLVTDADGRCTLVNLIPGARYVMVSPQYKPFQEFTVEAGKTVDLGAIKVTANK